MVVFYDIMEFNSILNGVNNKEQAAMTSLISMHVH